MPSPIDALLDKVDWTCTKCGVSTKLGCHCWDRTTREEKQVVATAIRKRFQVLLRTAYRQLYENRSARVSFPNSLYNAVIGVLGTFDKQAPRGCGVQADDIPVLVVDISMHWTGYVIWMYENAWDGLGEAQQTALVQAVETLVEEEMRRLVT